MSVRRIKAGTVDVSIVLRIIDSTDGTPETGVVFNTSGIDLWYRRDLAASVDITEATLAALTTAHADGGFLHINDGSYRLDLPDAACASGVEGVQIGGTVTGMIVLAPYIELPANIEADTYGRVGAPAGASVSADILVLDNLVDDLETRLSAARAGYLDALNGMIAQTGDSYARLGAPAGASVSADIAAIEAQTDDIGAAGAGLTAADDAILAILGSPAGASLSADVAAVKVDTAAILVDTGTTLDARIPAALVSGRMDASVGAMAANVLTATAINADAFTAAKFAADVTTELQSGLATAAALTTIDDFLDTEIGAIKGVTDKLDTAVELDGAVYRFTTNALEQAPTSGGAADGSGFTAIPWNAAWDAEVQSECADALNAYDPPTNAELVTEINAVQTDVAAVKVDTAAILVDTGTTLDARIPAALVSGRMDSSVGAMAANVMTAAAAATDFGAEVADAVWDEALSGHATVGTAGQRLQSVRTGTAQAGAATTITLDASASAVDDFYNDTVLFLTAGTGVGQSRTITNYVGATKVATVDTWATNPSSDSVFQILPSGTAAAGGLDAAGVRAAVGLASANLDTQLSTIDTVVDAVLVDTAEIGAAGAGLTNINLPNQTMDIVGNITGNLSGSVGSVTGAVGSVTGAVGSVSALGANAITAAATAADFGTEVGTAVWATTTRLLTAGTNIALAKGTGVTGFNDLSAAQVQTEIDTALEEAIADSVPADGSIPSVRQALYMICQFLYERSVSGTTVTVRKADGSTSLMTLTLSDATTPVSISRTT